MYDLVYTDYYGDAPRILERHWPRAKTEDASDFIHTERFAIEVEGVSMEDYLRVIIYQGLALVSLHFQALLLEDVRKAKQLVKEVTQGGRVVC